MRSAIGIRGCDFCDEYGGSDSYFLSFYHRILESRCVLTAENFWVAPTIGQLAPGHLLIISKSHYNGVSELGNGLRRELYGLIDFVSAVARRVYGLSPLIFEHGTFTQHGGGCGVDHLHVHVVPCHPRIDLVTPLRRHFKLIELSSICEVGEVLPPPNNYICVEDADRGSYAALADRVPSQFLRRLLADSLGNEAWDWRKMGVEPELVRTFETIKSGISTSTPILANGDAISSSAVWHKHDTYRKSCVR